MGKVQQLLIASEQLYSHLTNLPADKDRDAFIENIDTLLDARGAIIDDIQASDPNALNNHPLLKNLIELDKGIKERLLKVKNLIKADMQQLQTTKASEQKYTNPYASVRTMDGMYYDRKN
ncbi:flagellar protein FliT [Viridibacillus sp. FSL R5-0477]|uniref:Flagellar protein FliT n=1 Tax=Viridibacillus arenosi FSL R5-213 TaxID=1227360 RepID=W4F660_9BACL|nr:flagellar protein FliT [Viridibacillus arenosi]ETT87857.1 flagellar protein [Viridibacillus arenosi FSL R5-213]OMC89869.1 flagellar protein FliT [Viridibacillus arenosi]